MDYLCELPNDAARRVALDSLPPDLKSTYERILNRVNQSNPEAQKLVRRSLRWIANVLEPDPESYQFDRIDTEYFNTRALCEAVSIDLGSAKRNPQTIPDEFEILHWCSSLVRKSADGQSLELAHFTVEEFLKQIDPGRDLSIAQYRIEPITDGIILAKVCLTYLNLEDFDQTDPFRLETVESRFQKFPFRKYAVASWPDAVRDHLNDNELFSLVQKLLNPSKPSTFVTWTHDVTFLMLLELEYIDDNGEVRKKPFNSGLPDMTTLHWAAIYKLSEVGIWLINSGCDVNRNSALGTPLLCASDMDCYYSMGWKAKSKQSSSTFEEEWAPEKITFIEVLLDAGADPNCLPDFGTFAVYHGSLKLVMRLVDMGLVLDSNCLHSLETRLGSEDISEILDHTSINSVHPQNRDGLIQLALKAKASNATSLIQEDMELPHRKKHYEVKLRTAAEYGQVDVVRDLLEAQKLDVDAADQNTGKIALHHAAETDHIEVAQMLIDHGADSSKADSQGKTAVHHSLRGRDLRCLKFFVHGGADTIIQDLEGMTIWHLAAQEGNAQALTILLNRSEDSAPAIDIKAKNGKTPLLCASGGRSKEAVSLLLNAGSNLDDTASDGSSSLHYAAESGSPENSESGSLEVVEFLMEQGVDPFAVTGDGLNAIHRAIASGSRNTAEIVRGLLEKGLDAHTAHNDGYMPLLHLVKHESRYLHLSDLVKKIKQDSLSPEQLDCLFAASQALLKSSLKRHRFVFDMELGSELLNLACLRSSSSAEKTVSALMDLGLDFNIRFDGGMPALMVAAEKGKGAILSILLRNGADPCINASGLNALHCACFNDHIDIVVRLRESGVDWNSKATATICGVSRDMVTALHIAAQIRNGEILAYLLEEKLLSDINARTSAGQTALTVAVLTGASRNVSLLLSNGADDTFIDHFGHSAIQEAAQYGLEDVIAEFIQHGSDLGVPNSFGLTPELLARTCGHEALAKTITSYVNEQGGYCDYVPLLLCR
ncbi:MAG: hypothetical protein LQ338_003726 [Usnochroma carphineum]|nr:MAG: hypothetical protein LQ338_003726 [Usnochroma carphineum]